jgi:hypothetical protein
VPQRSDTSASGGWTWIAEVAGQELAKLEAAHPGLDAAALPALNQCLDAALLHRAGDTPSYSQAAAIAPVQHLSCTQGWFVFLAPTILHVHNILWLPPSLVLVPGHART